MNQIDQIINIPSDNYTLLSTAAVFNLNATVNSNLNLSYISNNINVVNVDFDGNIFISGPGKTSVKIFNNGDLNWKPVEKFVLINVERKKQVINYFLIDNKNIDSPNFSLLPYFFSSSGLPLKFKCLTPNLANIDEDGTVYILDAGTVRVEIFQEGNFEWEPVSIIQEFGVSYKTYPFNLNFKSNISNTLINFDLYKNENNKLNIFDTINGGLYFGDATNSLNKLFLLPTGEYIGVLTYKPITKESPTEEDLNTFYSFTENIYSGYKEMGYISFIVKREGFIDYSINLYVKATFNNSNGYLYTSKEAIESGIYWKGNFASNKDELLFSLPLFYNNKIENNIEGTLEIGFLNASGIPASLIQKGTYFTSSFVINNEQKATVEQSGFLPVFPPNLGIDLQNIRGGTSNTIPII